MIELKHLEQVIINYEMMTKALDAKLYDGEFYI